MLDSLVAWMENLKNAIGDVGASAIAIIATAVLIGCLGQAMAQFSKKNYKEGAKYIGGAIVSGMVLAISIKGFLEAGGRLAPKL